MTRTLRCIAFDADDTLWHNERFFSLSQARFVDLLSDHAPRDQLEVRLIEAERRNLGRYGFGVKGFVLSMIESALDVTDNRVTGSVIRALIDTGQEMLDHPIELLPHAREAIETLSEDYRILLITKGDLLHQERKLAHSGLGELFDAVHIVSDKTPKVYEDIFEQIPGGAPACMMVGNSMKSDVCPALDAGAWGVFVPHDLEWELETAPKPLTHPRYREISDLGVLSGLIAELSN